MESIVAIEIIIMLGVVNSYQPHQKGSVMLHQHLHHQRVS